VLPQFLGPISQVPPMYSALKRDGQPLYRLARQGIEVEREARAVVIHQLTLEGVDGAAARFRARVSKGTYIRTLAEDLARAVGSCAHLTALRRSSVAPFEASAMISLEVVEAAPQSAALLAPDAALAHMPAVTLDAERARRLRLGQAVSCLAADESSPLVRVYAPDGRFSGIGGIERAGAAGPILKPVRLFNDLGPDST
ncbi:MAG: tRNA pseudouridine(55) synthase TruB, partial [Steroidobacteraceae bacterium]